MLSSCGRFALVLTVLVSLAHVQLASAPGVTPSQEQTFFAAALRNGDAVVYEGPQRVAFAVTGPVVVMDRSGAQATAYEVRVDDGTPRRATDGVNRTTGRLETSSRLCVVETEGRCAPWRLREWSVHGLPHLFGATLLQGRPLRMGERVVHEGPCGFCGPIAHTIAGPTAESPAGTAFTVRFEGTFALPGPAWILAQGILHMADDNPFPLLVETPGGQYRLESVARGEGTLGASSDAHGPHRAPARALPFVAGLPPEGTPLEGHPSWNEARAQARAHPAGPLVDVAYLQEETTLHVANEVSVKETEERVWRWREARETHDVVRELRQARVAPLLPVSIRTPWHHTESPAGSTILQACAERSVPMWDLVRIARLTGALTDFTGFRLEGGCKLALMHVLGAPQGEAASGIGFRYVETVTMEAETGFLVSSFEWTD